VKLHTKFAFTEGPAADRAGNVYFSDIPNEKIHKVDSTAKLTVFPRQEQPRQRPDGQPKGEIVACEMDGQIAAYHADGKTRRVLAGTYNGKRFNAPNDLSLDDKGGVYFTDPAFRAPMPLPQGKTAVYYVAAGGKVTRLIDDLPNPNGVRLSPTARPSTSSRPDRPTWCNTPSSLPARSARARSSATLRQPKGAKNTGGDGRQWT